MNVFKQIFLDDNDNHYQIQQDGTNDDLKWTPTINETLTFTLNGEKQNLPTKNLTPELTLNEFLRENKRLTGTKYMCYQGGCGACVVVATIRNPNTNVKETFAVNSCLVALLSCQNWEIQTIESLGQKSTGLHKIQEQIVKFNGTQCGFCTPGMIMNMYALQQTDKVKMADIENAFGGNMCRCTGYRSILTAFKSMASDADPAILGTGIISDIEELKLCSKKKGENGCKQSCSSFDICQKHETPIKMNLTATNQDWYKVQTIRDIFRLFQKRGKDYQLVAGNTARGIYRDMNQKEYYIDITDVQELRKYQLNTQNLKLGANMTLNEVISVFKDVSKRDDGFKYLSKFVEHLDLVAHVPVRNVGTLAGNLSIKYAHNEFPSDIFVLFETVDAKIIIDNGGLFKDSKSPRDYLRTNMEKKIIHSIELPPINGNFKLETYKIMPRAQNAHAYLNAGFLIGLDQTNVVTSASFVFGGISADFHHAKDSESFIKGKQLFHNGNMQKLFAKLYGELHPSNVAPDPSPEFRKQLAVALMYKFILSIAPEGAVSALNKTGGEKLKRADVSTGVQDYKTNASLYPIGEPMGKLEAPIQATGEAEYITDMPNAHDQCFAAFVLGKAVAGTVLMAIDAQEALSVDGVVGFFQASDIPGVNSFLFPNPLFFHEDEEIFLPIGKPIKFYYEPVGVIVATSRRIAQRAANMVNVTFDRASHTPILTTKEAMEHDKNAHKSDKRIHHLETYVAKNTQEVTKTAKGVFETAWKYHYHMELQVVNVVPGDDGYFDIYPGTQWVDHVQSSNQRALLIPAHKQRLSVKRLGGSFGAKITRNNWPALVATLAAQKLNKPVRFMMSLGDNMNIMGKRNVYRSEYEVGVNDAGVIGTLKNELYNNVGAYQNAMLEAFVIELYQNTYRADTFQTDTFWVRTDNPAATMMRAPGSFEGCAVIENIMEHVAYLVDKDPIDVRLANLNEEANPELKKLIKDCLEWSNYRQRRADIEEFNKENRWKKKGIAIIPMTFSTMFVGPYHVQVSIFHADGTVAISHCGIEMGQGINTKTVQAAAHLLDIPTSMIQIWPTNNFVSPNSFATGGTVTTESVIIALDRACKNLLTRINQAATDSNLNEDSPWLDRIQAAFKVGVSLTENQQFTDDPDNSSNYKIYGVCVSEVEVDLLTGAHIVQRVDLLEDAGDSLNPAIDIGQCEGAFVMGMGNWTVEEIVLDEDGALKTNSTWYYKIPGARDIPVDFRVKLPDGVPNPITPLKNKATSEPPICLSFSVPLAIKHALKSARLQADEGADPWTVMEGPATIEWIFMSALPDFKQYKL